MRIQFSAFMSFFSPIVTFDCRDPEFARPRTLKNQALANEFDPSARTDRIEIIGLAGLVMEFVRLECSPRHECLFIDVRQVQAG